MGKHEGFRITTWNVNGIRNPFGYQPWCQEKTLSAMFEILEADIVVMQELKIQQKNIKDDMVLVPGWDVFFSLPKYKKGYSGVAVYTRNAVCAPIRAEEGITGLLTSPNSSARFCDLPIESQIGGYMTESQLSDCTVDASELDSEGRCLILEFPAFVLIGIYCPAVRDEARDVFRIGFLTALDFRVRNLLGIGKRVFLAGDLNVIREEIDTAHAEQLWKQGISHEEFISSPSRRIFNQLLVDGNVVGDQDEGRKLPVMWDICRCFHPKRSKMFTCWEQKINARPGNFGSRIDYVICSDGWKDWFSESNIQEGLMGSDHCPVYAVLKQFVNLNGKMIDIRDIMSNGMFRNGVRQREWCTRDLLPLSAKLLPEFNNRRSIKDMFSKKSNSNALIKIQRNSEEMKTEVLPSVSPYPVSSITKKKNESRPSLINEIQDINQKEMEKHESSTPHFEVNDEIFPLKQSKRIKPYPTKCNKCSVSSSCVKKSVRKMNLRGRTRDQSSLMEFFITKPEGLYNLTTTNSSLVLDNSAGSSSVSSSDINKTDSYEIPESHTLIKSKIDIINSNDIMEPITTKDNWSKLLCRRIPPRCEHNEPCISLVAKKVGINNGRSFYICPRPLGPSGQKEKNSEWRCSTFIWNSDWNSE